MQIHLSLRKAINKIIQESGKSGFMYAFNSAKSLEAFSLEAVKGILVLKDNEFGAIQRSVV